MPTDRELALKSLHYRRSVLRWITQAGAGHTGGSLSCVDILKRFDFLCCGYHIVDKLVLKTVFSVQRVAHFLPPILSLS